MESSLKKLKQNKYELTVELGKEELENYLKQAESQIGQEVNIAGFRRGKAPRDLLRKEVGDQYILETALNIALNDSLARTLSKDNLEVLNVSDLNVKENSPSKLLYTVSVNLFPNIELGDFSTIKLKRKPVTADKKEIDDAIDFIRSSRSKFLVKDGSIEKGDRTEVDFEVTENGLPIEGGISKNHPMIIGDNKFIPGFEENIIGLKAGEEKSFSIQAPKDYFHKSIAGKSLDVRVKVILVQKIEKPELNEDFIRSLGRFNSLSELENNIKEGILQEKKNKEEQRFRLEIISNIAEKSKIEVPEEMLKERLDEMVVNFDNDLHQKGMELSIYLAHLNKTEDNLRNDWREEADRHVRYSLILRKIAKDKNISPSEEEINQAAERLIQGAMVRGDLPVQDIDPIKVKEAVKMELTNQKVFSFLEKICSEN